MTKGRRGGDVQCHKDFVLIPEGFLTIAQCFSIGGLVIEDPIVPKGRLSRELRFQPSLRDWRWCVPVHPTLKCWAILGCPSGTTEWRGCRLVNPGGIGRESSTPCCKAFASLCCPGAGSRKLVMCTKIHSRPIGSLTFFSRAHCKAISYPASAWRSTPIAGSLVSTRSSRRAASGVPSATITCPAC